MPELKPTSELANLLPVCCGSENADYFPAKDLATLSAKSGEESGFSS
jgi:hypothetical protein